MNTSTKKLSPKALNIRSDPIRKLLMLIVVTCAAAVPALSVDRTWTGLGATNNWSEAANWSGGVVPLAADRAIFDSTSANNATIDVNVAITAILVNAGYTGTISQGSSSLTFSGACTFASGTFSGGSGPITFNSGFTLSGGTFTASTGTTTFAGAFTQSGSGVWNANGGTAAFVGSASAYNVDSSLDFNNVTVAMNNNVNLTISAGNALVVNGTLTLQDGGITNSGILDARGPVAISPDFDGGTGNMLISGATARTITIPSGASMPNLQINASNVTINTSGAGTVSLRGVNLQNVAGFTNGDANMQLIAGTNDWAQILPSLAAHSHAAAALSHLRPAAVTLRSRAGFSPPRPVRRPLQPAFLRPAAPGMPMAERRYLQAVAPASAL